MPRLKHSDWPDRLWFVRHGESAGNVARDHAESSVIELIDLSTRDADTPSITRNHVRLKQLTAFLRKIRRNPLEVESPKRTRRADPER